MYAESYSLMVVVSSRKYIRCGERTHIIKTREWNRGLMMMEVREMEPVDLRLRAEQRCFAEREINKLSKPKKLPIKTCKGMRSGGRIESV